MLKHNLNPDSYQLRKTPKDRRDENHQEDQESSNYKIVAFFILFTEHHLFNGTNCLRLFQFRK